MTLLNVNGLTLSIGTQPILNDVSFSLKKGETLALVGESGSGKSMTALSCMRLEPQGAVLSGSIIFDGQELIGAAEPTVRALRGARIGMIFQEPMTALNPLHTIGKQIGEMFLRNEELKKWRIEEKKNNSSFPQFLNSSIHTLLDQVGLSHFKDRLDAYPHQLSGGERQRVMIAMAIANNPDLLIADEPTTAVDVTIQAHLLTLLKELQQSMGMAMLFITHDFAVVRRIADRIAVMHSGRIVEQNDKKKLLTSPQHAYSKQLLGAEPKGAAVPLPEKATVLVEASEVSVKFPIKRGVFRRMVGQKVAVEAATFSLKSGETLGLVGESGSGKTTLALALLRLVRAEGTIVYFGEAPATDLLELTSAEMRPLRAQLQLVFQDPFASLNPRMTIGQIIAEGLLIHQPEADAEARVREVLVEMSLDPALSHRYPHALSGGQRQRVAVARAMILKPKLIVLDEPTSALDVSVQAQLLDLLKSLQVKYGLSYLFISHDLRVIRSIAHRVLVLKDGQIIESGETQALFAAPKEAYTKQLMDAAFLTAK